MVLKPFQNWLSDFLNRSTVFTFWNPDRSDCRICPNHNRSRGSHLVRSHQRCLCFLEWLAFLGRRVLVCDVTVRPKIKLRLPLSSPGQIPATHSAASSYIVGGLGFLGGIVFRVANLNFILATRDACIRFLLKVLIGFARRVVNQQPTSIQRCTPLLRHI